MTTPNAQTSGQEVPAQFCSGGPDAEAYGASAGYPKGDRTTFRDIGSLVGSHSHLDEIFPSRLIRKAPVPSCLARIAEPRITYEFDGASLTLDDYVVRTPTTGLLVARENTIVVERYQYGRTDRHRFTSASMAKTVTAMLVGIAIAEGPHPVDRGSGGHLRSRTGRHGVRAHVASSPPPDVVRSALQRGLQRSW
jgi:hypothetical protein